MGSTLLRKILNKNQPNRFGKDLKTNTLQTFSSREGNDRESKEGNVTFLLLMVFFCLISIYGELFSVYIVLILFGPFICSFPEIYYSAIYLVPYFPHYNGNEWPILKLFFSKYTNTL